jgi:hypothetical protein
LFERFTYFELLDGGLLVVSLRAVVEAVIEIAQPKHVMKLVHQVVVAGRTD